MFLLIDNYDSFVRTLQGYLQELGAEVRYVRNDSIDAAEVLQMHERGELEGIVISPGPKSPEESGNCAEIIRALAGKVPILGVCLGHQIIATVFGGDVVRAARPMHGKVTPLLAVRGELFAGLPARFNVTRYHSLVINDAALPDCLVVDARSDDGAIMAISHRDYPIYGVQFHPEAMLTEHGHKILANFINQCAGIRRAA